jgi:hypothetical protein
MKQETDYRNDPLVWFTTMQISADQGNFEKAAEAKKQLERLGVFVRFKGTVQRQLKQAEKRLVAHRRTVLVGSRA